MLPLCLEGRDAKADFGIEVYLAGCSLISVLPPKHRIPLGYCALPTPGIHISILFGRADVWDFWLEPLWVWEEAEEGEWIVPPRATPAVKNCRCGGAMMCSRFPGDTTDDLFRIPCALNPARLHVPSVSSMICFQTRQWPQERLHVTVWPRRLVDRCAR